MDEATFLNQYADARLMTWWHASEPGVRAHMLALITGLHATPLAQLDQYTVGLYTAQPDRWGGPRLVFAIKNITNQAGRAVSSTVSLSLALNPMGVTCSGVGSLHPNPELRQNNWTVDTNALPDFLNQQQNILADWVEAMVPFRKVNGRLQDRESHWPADY